MECCPKSLGSLVVNSAGSGNHLPGFIIPTLPLMNHVTLAKLLTISVP